LFEGSCIPKKDSYFLLDHNFDEGRMKGSYALKILFGTGNTNLYNISEDTGLHNQAAIKIKKSEILSLFN
jgi:hypothetical protein